VVLPNNNRHRSVRVVMQTAEGGGHGWRKLYQSGAAQVQVKKTTENFCSLNWQL